MNETQYYSAKTNNWGEVVGFEKDGCFYFLCSCANNPHEAKTFFYTDLTPVRFVPQEAVVIEGGDNVLKDVGGFSVKEILVTASRIIDTETGYKGVKMKLDALLAQLTPTKPRPKEGTRK